MLVLLVTHSQDVVEATGDLSIEVIKPRLIKSDDGLKVVKLFLTDCEDIDILDGFKLILTKREDSFDAVKLLLAGLEESRLGTLKPQQTESEDYLEADRPFLTKNEYSCEVVQPLLKDFECSFEALKPLQTKSEDRRKADAQLLTGSEHSLVAVIPLLTGSEDVQET
jgi:hypothetical protein